MHPLNCIEALEGRIAPASVITFTDVDGDTVIVKSTKGDLTGDLVLVDSGVGKQLTEIKLNQPEFQGTTLTIKVKKGGPGDGFVNVGYINAMGVDLNKVQVNGDIGRIDAGDGNTAKPAIKSLVALSIGAFGTTTQDPDGGGGGGGGIDLEHIREILVELVSTVSGTATGLLGTIQSEIETLLGQSGALDSTLQRLLTGLATDIKSLLDLGAETINNVGGDVQALLANIAADIDHLLEQVVLNPDALNGTLVNLLQTVSDSVNEVVFLLTDPAGLGGTIDNALGNVIATIDDLLALLSGTISTTIPNNLLQALDDAIDDVAGPGGLGGLLGAILGDLGLGTLVTNITNTLTDLLDGTQGSVTIGVLVEDLLDLDASITAALATNPNSTTQNLLNAVKTAITDILALPQVLLNNLNLDLSDLGGLLDPVTGQLPAVLPDGVSGLVDSINDLLSGITGTLTDLLANGGEIAATTLRDLALLETQLVSLLGTIGSQLTEDARTIINTVITDILGILGTVLDNGGDGGETVDPALQSNILGTVNSIKVKKDISNVFLNIAGSLKSLTLGGSLIGGTTANSGEIFTTGDIGKIAIKKNIIGGLNLNSGLIQSSGGIKTAKLGGSIIGGVGNSSGELLMTSDAKSIQIRGDLIGNEGLFAASIDSTNGSIKNLKIGGSVVSGLNTDSGSIRVLGTLGNLTIKGNVIGDDDNAVFISAAATKDAKAKAFNKVTIGGRVAFANILGGYDTDLDAINAHAQIGSVSVRGDWIGSNLVAGAISGDTEPENFGTNDDAVIPNSVAGSLASKIASIVIKGTVIGTTDDAADNFGFVAQEIGKFKLGKNKQALTKGAGNDAIKVSQGTGSDVAIHEIGANLA